jgi:hypothetical protein
MFFNSTTAVELESSELTYLEEHEVEGGGLPYLQILTHPNEDIVDVKDARPWGIFLNSENAEAINFKPDENWKPVTFYTVEGQGFDKAVLEIPAKKKAAYESAGQEITEQSGYLSTTLMFHLIYQSESEVERRDEYQGRPSFKFVGLRWSGDEGNKERLEALLKERDADNNPTHRWCQRYMFILVGADGNPLHDGVITWRSKGGAGGAFSSEMKELFKDMNAAYGEGKGNKRLNLFSGKNRHCGDMRSFVRLAMQFDLYKEGKDRAPYLVPVGRVLPTGNPNESKVRTVPRGKNDDRTVQLYPCLLIHGAQTQMMVPQSSPMGERIRTAIEEYKSFPLPMQGKETESTESGSAERPYSGEGYFDPASLQLINGINYVSFVTDQGEIPLAIGAENVEAMDYSQVRITGIIPADGGPVTVTSWEDATPAPLADEQKSLVEAF